VFALAKLFQHTLLLSSLAKSVFAHCGWACEFLFLSKNFLGVCFLATEVCSEKISRKNALAYPIRNVNVQHTEFYNIDTRKEGERKAERERERETKRFEGIKYLDER
jgi:hypothetical protein